MRCRSQRSTSTPANGASTSVGIWPQKPDDAEQQGRAGEPVDQPAGGDARDPGADERNALAAEEQPVVAVPERAEE